MRPAVGLDRVAEWLYLHSESLNARISVRLSVALLLIFLVTQSNVSLAQNRVILDCPKEVSSPPTATPLAVKVNYAIGAENVNGLSLGFHYDAGLLEVDSVSKIGSALPNLAFFTPTSINLDANTVLTGWADFTGFTPIPAGDSGLAFTIWFTIPSWAEYLCVDIDTIFVPPAGSFIFSLQSGGSVTPNYIDCWNCDVWISGPETDVTPPMFDVSVTKLTDYHDFYGGPVNHFYYNCVDSINPWCTPPPGYPFALGDSIRVVADFSGYAQNLDSILQSSIVIKNGNWGAFVRPNVNLNRLMAWVGDYAYVEARIPDPLQYGTGQVVRLPTDFDDNYPLVVSAQDLAGNVGVDTFWFCPEVDTKKPVFDSILVDLHYDPTDDGVLSVGDSLYLTAYMTSNQPYEVQAVAANLRNFFDWGQVDSIVMLEDVSQVNNNTIWRARLELTYAVGDMDSTGVQQNRTVGDKSKDDIWMMAWDDACNPETTHVEVTNTIDLDAPLVLSGEYKLIADMDTNFCLDFGDSIRVQVSLLEVLDDDILSVTTNFVDAGLSKDAVVELYDDGTHGDAVAGDGAWTLEYKVGKKWSVTAMDPSDMYAKDIDGWNPGEAPFGSDDFSLLVTAVDVHGNATPFQMTVVDSDDDPVSLDTKRPEIVNPGGLNVYPAGGSDAGRIMVRIAINKVAPDAAKFHIFEVSGSTWGPEIDLAAIEQTDVSGDSVFWRSDYYDDGQFVVFGVRTEDDCGNWEFNETLTASATASAGAPTACVVDPPSGGAFWVDNPVKIRATYEEDSDGLMTAWPIYRMQDIGNGQPGPWWNWDGLFPMSIDGDTLRDTISISSNPADDGWYELYILTRDSTWFDLDLADAMAACQFTFYWGATPPQPEPPSVFGIQDQETNEGGSFAQIPLDQHVTDPDNADSAMDWTFRGNSELTLTENVGRLVTVVIPNSDWYGSETIIFRAEDPDHLWDEDSATFTVFPVNDPPRLSNIPDQRKKVNNSFAAILLDDYVSDVDNPDATITWTASDASPLTVSIVNRVATVTPPSDWLGSRTVTFTATDTGGLSDSDDATYEWTNEGSPPVVTDIPDQHKEEGEEFSPISLDSYVTDDDNQDSEITWTAGGGSNLVASIQNRIATVRVLDEDWNGTELVWFKATDPDLLSDTDTAAFTVTPVNDAPRISGIENQQKEGGEVFDPVPLDSFVIDVDNELADLEWTCESQRGELNCEIDADRIATITPVEDVQTWAGYDIIRFVVTDPGGLADTAEVTFSRDIDVLISVVPESLIASAPIWSTETIDTTLAVSNAGLATLFWECTRTKDWVSLDPYQGVAPSEVMVTIDPAFMTLGYHYDTLTFRSVNDPDPDSFEVPVRLEMQKPQLEIVGRSLHTFEDLVLVDTVRLEGGTPLLTSVLVIEQQPRFGSLTRGDSTYSWWVFEYTPFPDHFGVDTFICKALVGEYSSDNTAIEITVEPVNDAPALQAISVPTIEEGQSFDTLYLSQYVDDVDDDLVDLQWSCLGGTYLNCSIVNNNSAILTPPDSNWYGEDTLQFTVEDDDGAGDTVQVICSVTNVNDPPQVSSIPGQTIDEGSVFSYVSLDDYVTDIDDPDSMIAWSFTGQQFLELDTAARQLTISPPDEDWFGSETITFTARDTSGASASTQAEFTVNDINDSPEIVKLEESLLFEGGAKTMSLDSLAQDSDNDSTELIWSVSALAGNYIASYDGIARTVEVSPRFSMPPRGDLIRFICNDPLQAADTALLGVTSHGAGIQIVDGLTARSYRMISLPADPDNSDRDAVLDELAGNPGDFSWRLGYWDCDNGSYIANPEFLEVGRGYWLVSAENELAITMSGTARVPDTAVIMGTQAIPYYVVPLRTGFNQIGIPCGYSLDLAGTMVRQGQDIVSVHESTCKLSPAIWHRNSADNGYDLDTLMTAVVSGDGYWIYLNEPCSDCDLLLDAREAGSALSKFGRLSGRSETDWQIRVEALCGDYADRYNLFGVRANASNDHDRYDIPEPPTVSPFVSATFGKSLTSDYRDRIEIGEQWDLSVWSDLEGEMLLHFTGDFPSVGEGLALLLTDLDNGETYRIDDNFCYRYVTESDPRHFKIEAFDAKNRDYPAEQLLPHEFKLYANYPNPFNASTTIDFDLPQAAPTRIVITNAVGQQVREFDLGYVAAGYHSLAWDGNDHYGNGMPSGLYFYTLRADRFSQTRKMVLLK